MIQKEYDVIVLGVGGMGSATCYHLAKQGVNVLGIEQFTPAHSLGSSHGDTRVFRQAYFEEPSYVPLLQRAKILWHDLENESNTQLFHETGVVVFGPEDGVTISGMNDSISQFDLPIIRLSSTDANKRFKGMRVPDNFTGLFEPTSGFLKVEDCVQTHINYALSHGSDIHFEESVQSIILKDTHVKVTTTQGTYESKKIIFTAGPWTPSLLKKVGLSIPSKLEIHRKLMFWFPTVSSHYKESRGFPCFAYESNNGFYYGTPQLDSSGLKVAEHIQAQTKPIVISHPDRLNRKMNDSDLPRVAQFLSDFFPTISKTPTRHLTCMYTVSEDENFIIDHHPQHDNVIVATGFSGHGFKFAPVVGEILSAMALEKDHGFDIEFLNLGRFTDHL